MSKSKYQGFLDPSAPPKVIPETEPLEVEPKVYIPEVLPQLDPVQSQNVESTLFHPEPKSSKQKRSRLVRAICNTWLIILIPLSLGILFLIMIYLSGHSEADKAECAIYDIFVLIIGPVVFAIGNTIHILKHPDSFWF